MIQTIVGRTFGVYGKLGTTVGRPATSVMGASGAPAAGFERGFGLSYGAGVSVAFTPRLSATPAAIRWPGPALGQHNGEVYGALGLDAAELEALRGDGII